MRIDDLLTVPCTITTRRDDDVDRDAYGNPVTTTSTVSTVCELQQRQRTETTDLGDLTQDTWLLVLPAATDLGARDTVTVDGVAYEVTGEPWIARNPRTGLVEHIEATVTRAGEPRQDAGA